MDFFQNYFEIMSKHIKEVDVGLLIQAVDSIKNTNKAGGKLIIAGNGGSAAMASHVAVDLTKSAGVRAVTFNEADLITCFANDYGYEGWIEKALDFYADKKDIVILISSSGRSKNMVRAGRKAKEIGLPLITFSGFDIDNPLKQLGDINFWVESKGYNIIEMVHHIWLVAIVDKIIGKIEYSA